MDAMCHIVVILAAVLGLLQGWRKGFTGQISGILGLGFGAVCAHVFADESEGLVKGLFPSLADKPGSEFIYSFLGAACVYLTVYLIFSMLTGILRAAMQALHIGLIDSLLGAAFCATKYLVFVSIIYNIIVCVNPRSSLMRYATADDGNVVQEVMALAPALIGSLSFDDFAHILQLREARSISAIMTVGKNMTTYDNHLTPGRNIADCVGVINIYIPNSNA